MCSISRDSRWQDRPAPSLLRQKRGPDGFRFMRPGSAPVPARPVRGTPGRSRPGGESAPDHRCKLGCAPARSAVRSSRPVPSRPVPSRRELGTHPRRQLRRGRLPGPHGQRPPGHGHLVTRSQPSSGQPGTPVSPPPAATTPATPHAPDHSRTQPAITETDIT
jgi:hypothetical protein